jgi:branched-chain amino acid transport system substrate-binding protein
MNPVALKTAVKTGYPVSHIVGNVWSNSEEDVRPAGAAAKGYVAITTQASGAQYPVLQEIIKTVYGSGHGNLSDKTRIGSVYHNLGIVNGILNVEAVRIAQQKYGHRTLTGDEVRWGFENLRLDEARVAALGAKDLFHSINVTCANHEGEGRVTFQQWDGTKWNVVSDWIAPDWTLLRPIIEKAAAQYATEKGITPRSCAADAKS